MKVDKFDYKKYKNIILDTIRDLDDQEKIQIKSFTSKYYQLDFGDVKKQIKILIRDLQHQGVDLSKFMKDYKDQIYKDFDFVAHDAFLDSLLYWFDKEEGILSGLKLSDSYDEEFFIKYCYGYYNYDMGKRFILQSYNSLEEYYEETANRFLSGLFKRTFFDNVTPNIIERCSIIRKYGNGYTIYAHLNALLLEIKSGVSYDNFIKEIKDILGRSNAYRIFDGILEIYIGYKKNPITIEEFKEIQNDLDVNYQANLYNL